jgi:Divergent InlB B-repeat domain
MIGCGEVQPLTDGGPADGTQRLTVSVTGGGTVTSTPPGIDCGATCSADFPAGTSVTLTATATDVALAGWSGDCAGADACTLTMDGAKTVMAGFAARGSKRWLKHISFERQDTIEKIAVDPQGNVIAAGTVDDGNGIDLFVVKYGRDEGNVMWMQRIDTGLGANLGGLAIDEAGNAYIAARLQGDGGTPVTIGTTPVIGDLFGNVIALRLGAADGAIAWVKQWGGDGQDIPEALAVSGTDLYVVGTSSSSPSTFDSKSFAGSGEDGFLVRASTANGVAAELKHLDGSIEPLGIAVNGNRVAIAGQVRIAMTIDRCSLSPSGAGADAMIVDFQSSTLACQWAKNFGDSVNNNTATVQSLAAHPDGGWVVIGDFRGSILLAPSGTFLTSRGDFDVFTGRFAGDGTHLWSFRYGDIGFDLGYGVAVTPDGAVVLAGTFNNTITFGLSMLTGVMNTFVTRMSPGITPSHEWAVGMGGDNYDLTEALAVAPDGSVYVASLFNGMTNVAGTLLTAQDYDSWIAALVR